LYDLHSDGRGLDIIDGCWRVVLHPQPNPADYEYAKRERHVRPLPIEHRGGVFGILARKLICGCLCGI
jgi:hypothetical protein